MNKKIRDSNLEFFRIIAMFLIVAHHYVVNSGLTTEMAIAPLSASSLFLYLFGMWGKIGINCYLLITGYFMCNSEISLTKFIKLWFEIVFYRLIIYFLFLISGHHELTFIEFLYALIPINDVMDNFVSCFLLFYLFIPFLNILIKGMSKRQHRYLIILCVFIYTLLPMFFVVYQNYILWFSVTYIIAAYIRLYQIPYYNDVVFWGWATLLTVGVSCFSVLLCIYFNKYPYKFVYDSFLILPIITSICAFMFFKNTNIKYNKWINRIGASTFGVLLIHANSATMRQWLWTDILNNVQIYYTDYLFLHAVVSVLIIFATCSILDQIRLHYIEKPLFRKIEPLIQRIKL